MIPTQPNRKIAKPQGCTFLPKPEPNKDILLDMTVAFNSNAWMAK